MSAKVRITSNLVYTAGSVLALLICTCVLNCNLQLNYHQAFKPSQLCRHYCVGVLCDLCEVHDHIRLISPAALKKQLVAFALPSDLNLMKPFQNLLATMHNPHKFLK